MNVTCERSKRLGRITGLPDAVRRGIPPSTSCTGLSSLESCSLPSQLPTSLSGRMVFVTMLTSVNLWNVSYEASLSLRTFPSPWKCPSSLLPTMLSPWMLTLLCNLKIRQSSNEGTNTWISQRILRSLPPLPGRILPTKKGPQKGNPRICSRFFTKTLLASNEHSPPLTYCV